MQISTPTIISRWRAFSIHMLISIGIGVAVLALMLLLWYPHPLFYAVGGKQLLMILLVVDVALGPLITLTIFDLKKKSLRALKFDLVIIAALQVTALLYGMNVVYQARPAYVVFSKNSFDLVTANELSEDDLAKAPARFQALPLTGPVYAFTEKPTDIKLSNEVVWAFLEGKRLFHFPQYYEPYNQHGKKAGKAALPLSELKTKSPVHSTEIDKVIIESGKSQAEIGYLPLFSKMENMTVLVNKQDGNIIKILRIDIW
ncbi:MAG: TfpX/TfpZ family type IV pilin accessory protein [Gallionella sp.]